MSYDCDGCEWTSGEDSAGQTMPDYDVSDGVQTACCPSCGAKLGERENNLGRLGARFS